MQTFKIESVHAREILDSRGVPTLEVETVLVDDSGKKARGFFMVPSGASTGEGEALELRDGDSKRYQGKGVLKAVSNVNTKISEAIIGKSFSTSKVVDLFLNQLDGTPTKKNLGANAILGVSISVAQGLALLDEVPAFEWIAKQFGTRGNTLPVPLMNVLNGGKHADNGLAIQEFMIVPHGFTSFSEALRAGSEIFHTLKKELSQKGLSTGVGDEGGFAPRIEAERPHEEALRFLCKAIEKAGYKLGDQVSLALDCAASEFCQASQAGYLYAWEGAKISSSDLIEIYAGWAEQYPIISIEDGLGEHDWKGWSELTARLGKKVQLVGDDLFVTNVEYLKRGIAEKSANAILIKVNQIGTLAETLLTMKLANEAHFRQIASHRSGETEDTFIAHLAVGTDCGQIKTGSLSRTDRIAKYNELLRIEEKLGKNAQFAGRKIFLIH